MPPILTSVAMLVASNVMMTIAWYWHLKHTTKPLVMVILISWAIAFFEYCIAVPANRWGYATMSAAQLKIIQEVVTMSVFAAFAVLYLGEKLTWNYLAASLCLVAAAGFIFWPDAPSSG
jgi:uncharacterized protein